MSHQVRTYLVYSLLLVWVGLLAGSCWHFYTQAQSQLPGEFSEMPVGYGGNEWVTWENSADGVVAVQVHPLISGNGFLQNRYIQKGDVLRKLDYEDVYDAEVVNEIVAHASPGSVLLFQVERKTALGQGTRWENLFIENSFDPVFSFTQQRALWSLFPWMVILGTFLSLTSLLILYPILRPVLRTNWPLLGVVALAFGVFGTTLVRHLNLLVRTEYSQIESERVFIFVFALFVLTYSCIAMRSLLVSAAKWLILGAVAVGILWMVLLWQCLWGNAFGDFVPGVERFVLFFLLATVLTRLALSVLEKWRGRSWIDKVFHILSLLYVLPLFLDLFPGLGSVEPRETTLFFGLGAALIPMISSTASQLKFGRVSVVLTSSIQFIVFSGLVLLLYYLLRTTFQTLGLQFKYQNYLEVAVVVLLVLAVRGLYQAYEPRFRRYFILAQQEKRDRLDAFIARIPQYSSSRQLMDDLVEALRSYFGAGKVSLWMRHEESAGDAVDMAETQLVDVFGVLQTRQTHWAKNRQMTMEILPQAVEGPLSSSPYAFCSALGVNDEIYGLLLLGQKGRGVYNLDDLELISRTIQQTQLTLGVLHLLERERLLLQKNYEANLTALRSQINPHFLFNTLNTISALIHDAPDDAEVAVEKLAFIFRFTLKHSDRNFIAFGEEMTLVRTYLEIEQIRFGARLELKFDLDPKMMEVELPAFVVQTIVENAIKHGIARIIEKGVVRISSWREEGFFHCAIEDNGPGIDHAKIPTSTGLNNILTRLEQIYETKNLLYFQNTGQGTRVTIKIPL